MSKSQATIQRVTREAGLAGSASAAGETQTGQYRDRNGDAAVPPHDAPFAPFRGARAETVFTGSSTSDLVIVRQ